MPVATNTIADEILAALGLSDRKHIRKISLIFEVGAVVRVELEEYVDVDTDKMRALMKRYHLEED